VSCIFCAIVAGQEPASLVHDDDVCLAFMDLYPVAPGHLLVVPKEHAPGLAELDADAGRHMFVVAQRLAAALRRSGLRCEGVNLFLADGEAAGQEVFHVHLHVVPRFQGDGFKIAARHGRPARAELDAHAELLRQAGALQA
jgi:diadenosine tetraphosphate (Ap4A) HIT family hydrolase